ncbi:tRNA glutamyl-Q(34) synthetase GluQRS [Acidiphilium iwatense]|uniref:tRNA glutamyl-Q(34) synthetase GluQRS n=1 Tax=Acidiphilium iwatense TaxID=768198 RepID=A0ABS9DVL6_9PROT|nr:tRNA glutamyl-Q(34) synthetase GluQRS [Acidiphilium iwatense]MCF3946774.1 tRNA glutamyl-Q(34) synthetase GluQRS [Acidiphilium iwatense]
MSIVTRFAPSPTGYLHLGHAASALTGWRRAREAGGRYLLRIEDIDATRCRPEYTTAIVEDLAWLGLDWDGDIRIQSDHMAEYRAALDALDAMGLLYPCFCTRAEITAALGAPHGYDAPYPGICRHLGRSASADRITQGDPFALRLRMDVAIRQAGVLRCHEVGEGWIAADPAPLGDVVLARKDIPASYHLCVTHDDAVQGVTLVTRGADLRAATPIHVLLQRLMGWPVPAYAHHALLTDPAGRRLAKRDRAATLRDLRASGMTQADIKQIISCRIGRIASL